MCVLDDSSQSFLKRSNKGEGLSVSLGINFRIFSKVLQTNKIDLATLKLFEKWSITSSDCKILEISANYQPTQNFL